MATVGILHEYSDGEDWVDFVERLDQYFVANNMAAVGDAIRRRAVLLTVFCHHGDLLTSHMKNSVSSSSNTSTQMLV